MILIALFSLFARAESIQLDRTEGPLPLHVKIVGPSKVLDAISKNQVAQPWIGCGGIGVDWKDQSPMVNSRGCKALIEHTFYKPGRYEIVVGSSHPGPDDGAVRDWTLTGPTVIVKANPSVKKGIAFLMSPEGQTQFPDKNLDARASIIVDSPAILKKEVVDLSGKVLIASDNPVPESGEYFVLPVTGFIPKSATKVKLQLRLVQNGKEIATLTSGVFTLASENSVK